MKWFPSYRALPISTVGEIHADFVRFNNDIRRPLNDEQVAELGIGYRMAFSMVLAGQSTAENWAMIVCSLNIGLILSEWGMGIEHCDLFKAALEGASRAKYRGDKTGKYGFDGAAIQAIQDAFDVHEAQIQIATKRDLVAAVKEVHRRAEAGIAYREAA
ncbi:hypothetical protein [Herbaspirillum sp. ST 5-3]|uniref:hypothetical protein n=1 Tax=Oxalobacteraceae TaxID=75682 RepID=UPI0010A52098|nr:hypothetical protein [Herbaspirillum sp. ST 5-3]